jgi:lysophospholipase L1-like esterase
MKTQWLGWLVRLGATALLAAVAGCGAPFANVFMGDSITAFWSVPGMNLGYPGNTTAQMLARYPDEVPNRGYRTFLLLGGTNDIRYKVPLSTAQANIATMASISRDAGMTVVLCLLTPNYQDKFTHDPDIRQLNEFIRQLAASEHYDLIDYYTPMYGHPEYFRDGLHPNAEGYAVMNRALVAVLETINPK